jgi:2-polyprenyl-3-methyl-5-hydroxy-6-metoxy-1,4-benzoquinol methylase
LPTYSVVECTQCGFLYNASFCGGGQDGELFSESYYRNVHADAFRDQLEDYRNDPSARVFESWLERVEQMIAVGRVLDVGSALGTFLKMAEQRGWQPQGVEISRFAAGYTEDAHQIPVFNGDLSDFDADADSFDLITFWDSIEHVTCPLENLQAADVPDLRRADRIPHRTPVH